MFSTWLAATCLVTAASASIFSGSKENLEARGSFGEKNPLSLVYNGQANLLTISLLNHGPTDLSIDAISGAFRETGGRERHLANTTAAKYSLVLPAKSVTPSDVQYRFYSELRPQDVGLTIWVDYSDTSDLKKQTIRTVAYDGSATIREPAGSWFDIQLLLLYPLVLALLALPLYFIYTSFVAPKLFPKKKVPTTKRRSDSTAVVAKSSTPTVGTPSEDPTSWIPAHHLKTRRTVSGRNLVTKGTGGVTPKGGVTSGDETSGNESASTPRRSARSNKGKGKAL